LSIQICAEDEELGDGETVTDGVIDTDGVGVDVVLVLGVGVGVSELVIDGVGVTVGVVVGVGDGHEPHVLQSTYEPVKIPPL
jgi:hypothetical protein